MYWDYYILGIILLPGIILSIYAECKVNSTFNKFHSTLANCGKTASEIARLYLDYAGLKDIQIIKVNGRLTDYYNHKKKIIALSSDVYDSSSLSAIGVACHEVGHALQYKSAYLPIKLRNLIIPLCNFSNGLLWPLVIIGAILYYTNLGQICILIGVGIFTLSVLLNLVTLPVEYNASKRACNLLLNSTLLDSEEVSCVKKVLGAAALTYVAGLVISILNLLRFILAFARRRD